jgi:hypothetical protein
LQVLGIDFTSAPKRKKPLACVVCTLRDNVLVAEACEEWPGFLEFEQRLLRPGPWIAGIDFPFGQARKFIETIEWASRWEEYVAEAGSLGRVGFRAALEKYRMMRPYGDKEHRRATDKAARSISPQKLYGVPVGLMFFEGAPRLINSGVTIPHMLLGDPERIVVEAYPGVLVRRLVGNASYKTDDKRKQTPEQRTARYEILAALQAKAPQTYGFSVEASSDLCEDPGADQLDALLCAVQAAWAWTKRDEGYGAPADIDSLEGWIADPHLLTEVEATAYSCPISAETCAATDFASPSRS